MINNFFNKTNLIKFWNRSRIYLIWILFITGMLLAASCYYVLFFTTAPVERMVPPSRNMAPEKNDFKISVFGDWMFRTGVIEKIGKESAKQNVDFAVCLGDFIHPSQAPVIRIAVDKIKESFTVPVYAVPGNHDLYDASDEAGFSAVFGNVNNFFVHGDTLFIMLDSSKLSLSKETLQYLKFILDYERPKYRRCVIFTHVPPVVSNPMFDESRFRLEKENAAELKKIIEPAKVDLIVSGHAHCEMDTSWGNTRVLVIPPCGQNSRDITNPQFGSLILHFQKDGSIKPEFVYYGDKVSEDKFKYFVNWRLNQGSIFFCVALLLIICSMILAVTGPKKEKPSL